MARTIHDRILDRESGRSKMILRPPSAQRQHHHHQQQHQRSCQKIAPTQASNSTRRTWSFRTRRTWSATAQASNSTRRQRFRTRRTWSATRKIGALEAETSARARSAHSRRMRYRPPRQHQRQHQHHPRRTTNPAEEGHPSRRTCLDGSDDRGVVIERAVANGCGGNIVTSALTQGT